MRTLILGAASAIALLAPATASAETAGFVDLSLGQSSIEGTDLNVITIGGAAVADVAPNWRAQFDVDANRYSGDGEFTATNAAAHLYYEGPSWAVGGVLANRDMLFGSIWSLGLEGQAHMGQIVLEGEVGFGTLESFGDSVSTTNADANVTFYATPNFSMGVGANYTDIDEAFGAVSGYSVDAEYKFDSSANSIFAGYNNSQFDDIDLDVDTWRIGFRHAFGDDTLQGRRETGPRWLRNGANGALLIG